MLDPIKFESEIKIENFPLEWVPKIELYYPDLPQYPITYIHLIHKTKRVYGFISSTSCEVQGDSCLLKILFLSNCNIDKDSELKSIVKKEIEERLGFSHKISVSDIISYCKGNKQYITFFKDLWTYVSKCFGDQIPYGKFYEEMYSMVRFVSAWQPKTGRQSEMRMLYNFMSIFGEEIQIEGKWDFLHFFLIPNYQDAKSKNYELFPKFKSLFGSITKMWNLFYTNKQNVQGITIHSMDKSWPQDKDTFMAKVTDPLYQKGKLTKAEVQDIDRLVDAFNRHSWRAAFYIWSLMTIYDKDYYTWDKAFFNEFYVSKKSGVGMSPKVVACFLQQGFTNDEIIPIDIWIESFYEMALGIGSKQEFFESFDKLGKIERLIWLTAQAKKTNMKVFFDMLWCLRYGVTGNSELRGPNPIGCYECVLRSTCPSFDKIKDSSVLILEVEESKVTRAVEEQAENKDCRFICLTKDSVPKKIFEKRGRKWVLIDEFSGYLLTTQKIKNKKDVMTVDKMIESLPNFFE